ncbi:MAG: hypothetical protein JWN14_1093, partial [Chthonomonadales bacterium]|nr:hypothetical protein [Chthonomonadales bacterium]
GRATSINMGSRGHPHQIAAIANALTTVPSPNEYLRPLRCDPSIWFLFLYAAQLIMNGAVYGVGLLH